MASPLDYLTLLLQFAVLLVVSPFVNLARCFGFLWKKEKDVSKEIVLVTGAGNGIGRLMALKFAALGSTLVLWDIDEANVKKVAAEIHAAGNKNASAYKIDLTNRTEVYALAAKVKSEVGNVTILVNNAGIVTGKRLLECPDELMVKTMEVNSISHFWTLKAFLPEMIKNNHGHIVTIASIGGTGGVPGMIDYCASKFAAIGLNESLRMELKHTGKHGVHTTCVCPYFIDTGMFEGAATKFPLLFPILKPNYVAKQIVRAVLTNEEMLALPFGIDKLGYVMRALLPISLLDYGFKVSGISDSMNDFKGRAKKTN